MPVKYGELMRPWRVQIQMSNNESGDDGHWKPWTNENLINYKYTLTNTAGKINLIERDPDRRFLIQNPHDYQGQLGSHLTDLWSNTEQVFVVNGYVNKGDGNFELPFIYKTLKDHGITIGSYPDTDRDC